MTDWDLRRHDNDHNFNYIGAAAITAPGAILGHTAIIDLKLNDSSNLNDTTYTYFVYTSSDILKLWELFLGADLLFSFCYLRKSRHAVSSERLVRISALGEPHSRYLQNKQGMK
jgi:hypothetical protein